jgi:hypothetical protein
MDSNLIGKRVSITDKQSIYYDHWGYIVAYDGLYHVSGGSISSSVGELTPIFNRDQFRVKRN